MSYTLELQNKILEYYTKYYKSYGLKNAGKLAEKRLNEEALELKRMDRLQDILNIKFNNSQNHFIFGVGTGGLAVVLKNNFGCNVSGIEPCDEEFDIIQAKLKQAGIDPSNFKKEFGENLSFKNNQFDFVHCYTVLEHVRDVKKCIEEIIRVVKPRGVVYINTPNYRYPEERHYKIFFPTFLPKIFGYLWLLLNRRPIRFLKSINFITEKKINKLLKKHNNIKWHRIKEPLTRERGLKGIILNFFKFKLRVYPMQEIVIKKDYFL